MCTEHRGVCVCVFVQTVALWWQPGVKALTWRIIQDSYGVLTHSSNTKGVTGWEAPPPPPPRCERRTKISAYNVEIRVPIGFRAPADVSKDFGHMSRGHPRMRCKQRHVSGVGGNVLPIHRIVKADRGKWVNGVRREWVGKKSHHKIMVGFL